MPGGRQPRSALRLIASLPSRGREPTLTRHVASRIAPRPVSDHAVAADPRIQEQLCESAALRIARTVDQRDQRARSAVQQSRWNRGTAGQRQRGPHHGRELVRGLCQGECGGDASVVGDQRTLPASSNRVYGTSMSKRSCNDAAHRASLRQSVVADRRTREATEGFAGARSCCASVTKTRLSRLSLERHDSRDSSWLVGRDSHPRMATRSNNPRRPCGLP